MDKKMGRLFEGHILIKGIIVATLGGFIGAVFGIIGAEKMSWGPGLFLIGVYTIFVLFILFAYRFFIEIGNKR